MKNTKTGKKNSRKVIFEAARSVSFNSEALEARREHVTKERKQYISKLSSKALSSVTA